MIKKNEASKTKLEILNVKQRKRDEQRQHRNTSNEDEQQRETVTEEARWLIDGSDKEEDEGLTLTMLIPLSACIRLPILATR